MPKADSSSWSLPLEAGPLQSWRCDARATLILRGRLLILPPQIYALLLCLLEQAEQETYATTEALLALLPRSTSTRQATMRKLYRQLSQMRRFLQECDLTLLCIRGYGYRVFLEPLARC